MSSLPEGCFKKPYRFIPSNSEASLTSFGTASRDVFPRHASAEGPLAYARGDIPYPVVPRHASAEGPLAYARGDKERGSGRQRERLEVTKKRGSGWHPPSYHAEQKQILPEVAPRTKLSGGDKRKRSLALPWQL